MCQVATSAARTSENAVNTKFGSAPVLCAEISREVAPLRVATACYKTKQRMLPGGGVWTPKAAALPRSRSWILFSPLACYSELPRIVVRRSSVITLFGGFRNSGCQAFYLLN